MTTPYLPTGFALNYLGHSTLIFETEKGATGTN